MKQDSYEQLRAEADRAAKERETATRQAAEDKGRTEREREAIREQEETEQQIRLERQLAEFYRRQDPTRQRGRERER